MHISENSPTILTKCTKMQKEEQNRKDGLNGNADSVTSGGREEPPRSAYTNGGRLKFFKDGKFILELERAREGERVAWVSVPRKTFWPPQGTATSTLSYRQESSTSLSVSDDNSSIQSSPWQRDHSWKQTNPRRNLSKEMTFLYKRNKSVRHKKSRKCRKPYDITKEIIIKEESNCVRTNVCNNKSVKKTSLLKIIQCLIGKQSSSSPPRSEMVISPRKRFLREMEKDTKAPVEEACQKRSRSKPISSKVASPVRVNGTTDEPRQSSRNSSYSITSLLAEDRTPKKSPANSPSHFSPGSVSQHQYCSPPTPEDRWYTESVDRLRSIELSHPDKRMYTPYPPSYVPPYVTYPYQHFYPAFGRGYAAVPSVYNMPIPIRADAPSCSWAAEPTRDTEHHRDENITDMPLNLSKHAG